MAIFSDIEDQTDDIQYINRRYNGGLNQYSAEETISAQNRVISGHVYSGDTNRTEAIAVNSRTRQSIQTVSLLNPHNTFNGFFNGVFSGQLSTPIDLSVESVYTKNIMCSTDISFHDAHINNAYISGLFLGNDELSTENGVIYLSSINLLPQITKELYNELPVLTSYPYAQILSGIISYEGDDEDSTEHMYFDMDLSDTQIIYNEYLSADKFISIQKARYTDIVNGDISVIASVVKDPYPAFNENWRVIDATNTYARSIDLSGNEHICYATHYGYDTIDYTIDVPGMRPQLSTINIADIMYFGKGTQQAVKFVRDSGIRKLVPRKLDIVEFHKLAIDLQKNIPAYVRNNTELSYDQRNNKIRLYVFGDKVGDIDCRPFIIESTDLDDDLYLNIHTLYGSKISTSLSSILERGNTSLNTVSAEITRNVGRIESGVNRQITGISNQLCGISSVITSDIDSLEDRTQKNIRQVSSYLDGRISDTQSGQLKVISDVSSYLSSGIVSQRNEMSRLSGMIVDDMIYADNTILEIIDQTSSYLISDIISTDNVTNTRMNEISSYLGRKIGNLDSKIGQNMSQIASQVTDLVDQTSSYILSTIDQTSSYLDHRIDKTNGDLADISSVLSGRIISSERDIYRNTSILSTTLADDMIYADNTILNIINDTSSYLSSQIISTNVLVHDVSSDLTGIMNSISTYNRNMVRDISSFILSDMVSSDNNVLETLDMSGRNIMSTMTSVSSDIINRISTTVGDMGRISSFLSTQISSTYNTLYALDMEIAEDMIYADNTILNIIDHTSSYIISGVVSGDNHLQDQIDSICAYVDVYSALSNYILSSDFRGMIIQMMGEDKEIIREKLQTPEGRLSTTMNAVYGMEAGLAFKVRAILNTSCTEVVKPISVYNSDDELLFDTVIKPTSPGMDYNANKNEADVISCEDRYWKVYYNSYDLITEKKDANNNVFAVANWLSSDCSGQPSQYVWISFNTAAPYTDETVVESVVDTIESYGYATSSTVSTIVEGYGYKSDLSSLSAYSLNKIYVDSHRSDNLSVVHVSQDDFHDLYLSESLISNVVYIISADDLNMYDGRVINIQDPKDEQDAVNLRTLSSYLSSAVQDIKLSATLYSPGDGIAINDRTISISSVTSDKVIIDHDISCSGSYSEIGNIKIGDVIQSKGRTLNWLLEKIFDQTIDPELGSDPYITVQITNPGPYEIGSSVDPQYKITYYQGRYSTPWNGSSVNDGTSMISGTVADIYGHEDSTNDGTGQMSSIYISDDISYTINGDIEYLSGDYALNNKGQTTDVIRTGGRLSGIKSSNSITGFRYMWIGSTSKDIDKDTITETQIRDLVDEYGLKCKTATGSFNIQGDNTTSESSKTIKLVDSPVAVIVAVPSPRTVTKVILNSAFNQEITTEYKLKTLQISGKTSEKDMRQYNVYVYKPSQMASTEIHTITIG